MQMVRAAAERLLANSRMKRRLPNGVQIFVSPGSQLKYLKLRFDSDLSQLAESYVVESSVVWDVGANCGVLAFSSARARQILAVEPDPFLADALTRSAMLGKAPVTVVTAAVSSHVGLADFSIARRGRAANHLTEVPGSSQAGGERTRIAVPTVTLDHLLDRFGPPTFVKIDIEGAEVAALQGAARLLSEARPVIYFEAVSATSEKCREILNGARYDVSKKGGDNWLAQPA
jgi:FkbM family methyltransferase